MIFKNIFSCHTEIFDRKLNKLVEEAFGPGFPSITEIGRGTALAFINTNPAFDYMAPLPENVIPVGGLQIKATNNPLPKVFIHYVLTLKFSIINYCETLLGPEKIHCFSKKRRRPVFAWIKY